MIFFKQIRLGLIFLPYFTTLSNTKGALIMLQVPFPKGLFNLDIAPWLLELLRNRLGKTGYGTATMLGLCLRLQVVPEPLCTACATWIDTWEGDEISSISDVFTLATLEIHALRKMLMSIYHLPADVKPPIIMVWLIRCDDVHSIVHLFRLSTQTKKAAELQSLLDGLLQDARGYVYFNNPREPNPRLDAVAAMTTAARSV